jgi:hypothetical protein
VQRARGVGQPSLVQPRGEPRERERARRRQVDGRLNGRERLDVVAELRLAVELRECVAVIRRAVRGPGGETAVRAPLTVSEPLRSRDPGVSARFEDRRR